MGRLAPAALLVLLSFVLCAASAGGQQKGRILLVGFDGLDHGRVRDMIAAGELPNLKRLGETGHLGPLATTEPAQSPVSWASMITGLGPGRTGIDGFLRRDFSRGDVRVRLSLGERVVDREGLNGRGNRRLVLVVAALLLASAFGLGLRRRRRVSAAAFGLLLCGVFALLWFSETALPDGRPRAVNARRGEAFWSRLDRAGIPTVTMLAPCSFPAEPLERGHLLCGFGTPDLRGTMGFWTAFRDDVALERYTETGGRVVPLVSAAREGDGRVRFEETALEGPVDLLDDEGRPTRCRLRISARLGSAGSLRIDTGLAVAEIASGAWSEPLPVAFAMGPLIQVRGLVRFRALRVDGEAVRVYADPIQFDPHHLPAGVALSHPRPWAAELDAAVGGFETTGWATATNALKDGQIDDAAYLEDARRVRDEQEALAMAALARDDARVVACFLTVPDRVQHVFSRYDWTDLDLDGRPASPEAKGAVAEAYRRADAFVGRVIEDHLRPDDLLLVVSDHGFAPWRRAVNLNRLLVEGGWLVLKRSTSARSLHENLVTGEVLDEVDWAKTRAYSLGLGKIYLNLEGREPGGRVTPEEAPALLADIEARLFALRDGGLPVVSSVSRGVEAQGRDTAIPGGPADLYVGFHRGWRVSWQTCLGGAHEPLLQDNPGAWSGDHCGVDPALVPGILASNRPLLGDGARVIDIAPTVLSGAGIPTEGLDGRSLLP